MKNKLLIVLSLIFFIIGSNAQTLDDYLKEAEKNSPELQARQYRYRSALEKVNEVGGLPDTKFSVGYFVQEVETRVGAQKVKLSASQNLPWFGALSARKESEAFKAEALKNEIDLYKRQLFLNVKETYYELYELKSKEDILNESISILKTYEKLALSELENNRSTLVDVLKIKMEQNELNNKVETIIENLKAKKIIFNLLLNRKEDTSIAIPIALLMEGEENFNRKLISQNPKLLKYDNIQKALVKSEMAVKKESLPIIGIGLDYVFVEDRDVVNLVDNGKDIIMPMVSVSVPLFSKKYSSRRKQLQLDQKALEYNKVDATNKLNALFETAIAELKNAKSTIKTQDENIIQADQAHKVLLTSYQTANMDFEQVLEIQQLKLKFQLIKIAAEKKYAKQMAIIQFLINS